MQTEILLLFTAAVPTSDRLHWQMFTNKYMHRMLLTGLLVRKLGWSL